MIVRRSSGMRMVTLALLIATSMVTLGMVNGTRDSWAASSGVVARDFSIPVGTDPWGTAFDRSGRVWVAIPGCDPSPVCSSGASAGNIAVYSPKLRAWVSKYQLPATFAQPLFLAFDRLGRVWFPMPMNNSLGMFDPTTASFHQWAVPTPGSGPWGVAIDSKGIVWFTEHYSNKIGAFNPKTNTFTEIATPASNSLPYGITVDRFNNVWFTENNSAVALIGEYTAQKQLREYKIRNTTSSSLTPHLITTDKDGNVWWSEGWAGMVGNLDRTLAVPGTNKGVTEYTYQRVCTGCGTHTSGISADSYGNIWFDDGLQSIFGVLLASNNEKALVYNSPTPHGHPHDGLKVDAHNTIWFDEEFANKLAHAVPTAGFGQLIPSK